MSATTSKTKRHRVLGVPAQSGLTSLSAWCPRFFLTVLASALASGTARSQDTRGPDIGPGPVTETINMGQGRRVVGFTQWTPPAGSMAASVGGPGTLTFNPEAGPTP